MSHDAMDGYQEALRGYVPLNQSIAYSLALIADELVTRGERAEVDASGDQVNELAQVLRRHMVDPSGTAWPGIPEGVRERYRGWAKALISEGWTK